MGSLIEWLCKRTLGNDINHLFCHRNVFMALVRLPYKIVSQQGIYKSQSKLDMTYARKSLFFRQ